MFDMTDLFRPLLSLARGLWCLGWDFMVETVGWSIGWPVWRSLTLGRFPKVGWHGVDDAPMLTALVVEFSGLAVLAGVIAVLARVVGE